MADVFISYSSQDRLRVKPLAEALEKRGFSVWWDRSLGAGEDYAAVITRELRAARAVIVVWTDNSSVSTFVRDEAGRARDEGRLVPVMLDHVEIPLGFGAFQAEDFSRWNGAANAPQMQLLEESLRAKLEGRAVDGGVVAAKRRRLMTRIRLVSVLGVIAAIAVIAFVGNSFLNPREIVQSPDRGAQLLDLVNQGKLTPEQAIQLAQLLENGALGDASSADNAAPPPASESAPGAAPSPMARSITTDQEPNADVQVASISQAQFDEAARTTYRDAMAELLRSPDAEVRTAAVQLANPQTRDAAMQTLWARAQQGGPQAAAIYRVCAAVGESNDHPLGLRAAEQARNLNPEDAQLWSMASYGLARDNRAEEAQGAALVSEGLQAQASGDAEAAEQHLNAALPRLQSREGRAFVQGALGDAAARRNDWNLAARRFGEAVRLREQAAPADGAAAPTIQIDAQKLVRALDRDGRTNEACQQAQQLEQQHDVATADPDLAQRCQQRRISVRPQVLQPRATIQRQAAPATAATP